MYNHTCMSASHLAFAKSMNSFLAETEIEPKVRYSNLGKIEIRLKLEIWPVSVPKLKPNFSRPLVLTMALSYTSGINIGKKFGSNKWGEGHNVYQNQLCISISDSYFVYLG